MAAPGTRALITGICGQDGTYLAEHLLSLGYEVWGLARNPDLWRLTHLPVRLLKGDLLDRESLKHAFVESDPSEVYNLAGWSDVGASFKFPEETFEANYTGLRNVVEEALAHNKNLRIYQASSSEMFGNAPAPQNENSPLLPVSPYATSKARAYREIVKAYRKEGAFICSGILFNHESPRRPKQFVTRKITSSLAQIALGELDHFSLGNIEARRDWGFAGDYVKAMHLMLAREKPQDFVIATAVAHSVREFIEAACVALHLPLQWEGEGVREVGRNEKGDVIISISKEWYRPLEPHQLVGDPSRARTELPWSATTTFESLVGMMVKADVERIKSGVTYDMIS